MVVLDGGLIAEIILQPVDIKVLISFFLNSSYYYNKSTDNLDL